MKLSDIDQSEVELVAPNTEQAKYGGTGQQIAAGVEGLARGISLGGSDVAEVALGIAKPEDVKGRIEANPTTSALSNMAGGAALVVLSGGLAAPAEAALIARGVAPLAARAMAFAAEGSVFGAGQVVSDAALGDPNLTAQKIATEVGFGALLGGGLGVLSRGVEASPAVYRKVFGKAAEEIKAPPVGAAGSAEEAMGGIGAPAGANKPAILDVPDMGIKPSSLADIEKRLAESKFSGESVSLPQKEILTDAASRVDLMNPIHPLQLESMTDQSARDLYKTALEMPGKTGDMLRNYEALQKKELAGRIESSIEELSPGVKPTEDAVEGGQRAIKAFTDQYEKEKEILGPLFEEFKKSGEGISSEHLPGVISKFTEAVPGIAQMLKTEGGKLEILPYSTKWGIDKATYTAAKDAFKSLESSTSLQELMNIRKGLDQNIDIFAKGQGPREIMALKKQMMDYVQDEIGLLTGEKVDSVRELYKRYAINEQQREVIERAFGASVGSPEFGAISKIKPEMISDNIFRNTATVQAAKEILPKGEFSQLLANWISENRSAVTDKGFFSSNKFATFLKKNQDALKIAFEDNPQGLQRLHDYTNISRILPDSASINPSGTAKTLWGTLKAHSITEVLSNLKEYGKEKLEHKMLMQRIEDALQGKSDRASRLGTIKGIVDNIEKRLEDTASSILKSGAIRGAGESAGMILSDKLYDDHVNRIKELAGSPEAMINHLGESTDSLYAAAPNVTQSLHSTLIAGVQFLNSKIPSPQSHFILGPEFKPSQEQVARFNRYYAAVNDPIRALHSIKTGDLTNETLEAITAVHPQLLDEMRKKVIDKLDPEKARNLSYPARMSLAKFLGQPLDANMLPGVRVSFQASLQGPSLAKQQAPKQQRGSLGALKELKVADNTRTNWNRSEQD